MDIRDIESEWAWSRIEAMADGQLDRDEIERMQGILDGDPDLRAALSRARQIRASLRAMAPASPPSGLLWRLLAVPSPRSRTTSWLVAPVGAAAVASIAALFALTLPGPSADPERVAIQEFVLAMSYVQETALVTRNEVEQRVGGGLVVALSESRDTLSELSRNENRNGD